LHVEDTPLSEKVIAASFQRKNSSMRCLHSVGPFSTVRT
jgi:hypothetical protein